MQEGVAFQAAPVAAVERVVALEVEGAADRPAVGFGHHQHDVVGHGVAQDVEEGAGEVGRTPFAAAGIHVEGEEGVPVPGLEIVAAELVDDQIRAAHRLALLADRLALARGEGGQEIVEGRVAGVAPVILPAEPQQPATLPEALPVGLAAEGGMDRADAVVARDLGQHVDHGLAHRLGERPRPCEQARTGHRCERDRRLELGIVAAAGAFEGLRPAVVEDVFALAVALHVERNGAEQRAVGSLGQQVLRLPAGAPADGLGILERLQEAVAEERVAARAGRERTGVPLAGVDARQGIDDAQSDGRGVIGHGASIARIVPEKGATRRRTKKVRQTEVAGQLRSFAFPPTQAAKVLHWL